MIQVFNLKILVNRKKINNMLIHIVTVVAISGDHATIFFFYGLQLSLPFRNLGNFIGLRYHFIGVLLHKIKVPTFKRKEWLKSTNFKMVICFQHWADTKQGGEK